MSNIDPPARCLGRLQSVSTAHPPLPHRSQVSTTSGIQVGQWVRIFARSPSRVAIRRGLLQGQATARPDEAELRETSASANGSVSLTSVDPAPAPPPPSALLPGNSSTAPLLAANPSPPPRPAYLPLPAAFVEGRRDAQAMGLDREEHLDPGQGVTAAAGDGTLDVRRPPSRPRAVISDRAGREQRATSMSMH